MSANTKESVLTTQTAILAAVFEGEIFEVGTQCYRKKSFTTIGFVHTEIYKQNQTNIKKKDKKKDFNRRQSYSLLLGLRTRQAEIPYPIPFIKFRENLRVLVSIMKSEIRVYSYV